MSEDNTATTQRKWHDSGHASLCLLGLHLCQIGFFQPLEEHVKIQQKVLKYTPIQKLKMLFVGLLTGIKAVSHTATTIRLDKALMSAFGLPGCAEQSVLADTLNAATEADVAGLRVALAKIFERYSQVRQHDFQQGFLVLDVDLSPLPASAKAEGSERGYMGRSRSKTGRKLVRVRAAATQETVWETVVPGRTAESLPILQEAITQTERLLGLDRDDEQTAAKRARTEIRLDSGWGSEAIITWLLARGYQVSGKFKSAQRVAKLVKDITDWQPTSSPGREVAQVPEPIPFVRPLQQYAVRTPSKDREGGYYHAVVFTSRTDLTMTGVVEDYDKRAGIEAALKGDKQGLALGVIRKRRLPAQTMVVLLTDLAHNVLIWARGWLAPAAPHLAECGIVRLIQQVCAVPGRVKVTGSHVQRIRLRAQHPRAHDVYRGFRPLLAKSPIQIFLDTS
jgi:type IV secretory pathway protease TraF